MSLRESTARNQILWSFTSLQFLPQQNLPCLLPAHGWHPSDRGCTLLLTLSQQSNIQARQLAKLVGAHGTDIACLILDVRDLEEHALCHIRGGALPNTPTSNTLDPAAVISMLEDANASPHFACTHTVLAAHFRSQSHARTPLALLEPTWVLVVSHTHQDKVVHVQPSHTLSGSCHAQSTPSAIRSWNMSMLRTPSS